MMDVFIKYMCVYLLINTLACQDIDYTDQNNDLVTLNDSIILLKEQVLQGQVINLDQGFKLGPLTDFIKINDRIYFFEQKINNDCFGALVDLQDGIVLHKIGSIGKGPFEIVSLFDFYKLRDSLYFFDYISQKLVVTQVEAILDTSFHISHENSREYRLKPSFPVDILMFIDNKWVTKNYNFSKPDSSLVEVAPYSLKPKKYFGKLPEYEETQGDDRRLKLVENLVNASVRPDGKKFVIAYKFSDLIEIFNADGNIQKSIIGPRNYAPILSESTIRRFDAIPIVNKTWHSYSKVIATDSCFYVGYIGKKEPPLSVYDGMDYIKEEYNTSSFSRIFKYDWDGNLMANYKLDKSISYFEMGAGKLIYATSGYIDEGLYRFSLK